MSKIKWKRPKHKYAYPWESSNVDNFVAVLEEQYNTIDEAKKEVKWMWTIRYNTGHVGCPDWGYAVSLEDAKRGAEAWFRGYKEGCTKALKTETEKAERYRGLLGKWLQLDIEEKIGLSSEFAGSELEEYTPLLIETAQALKGGGGMSEEQTWSMEWMREQVAVKICQNYAEWETVLSLHIKPKPKWVPLFVWKKILHMVLIQNRQTLTPPSKP